MARKTLLDGNAAAAWGARLSRAQVVPNFPVTPQTEIIETLAGWSESGEWKGRFLPVESEHSVLSAAVAASAAGARVFTGSSSQGLLLMHEVMYIASGMRLPIVMMNVSRALSAPITLWCFTEDAQVLMDDLTYKKINEVKEGDTVLGVERKPGGGDYVKTKVKKIFMHLANNLIELKTDKFDLTCTDDHKFYYHPVHERWIQARSLKKKSLKWIGHGFEETKEFMRGWLAGVIDGDGSFHYVNSKKRNESYFRFQIHMKDEDIINSVVNYSKRLGFSVRKHSYRKRFNQFGATISVSKEALRFKRFLRPKKNFDYCRGYLSGLYDAEGTGPYGKTRALSIYNANPTIIKRTLSYLDFLGMKYKTYTDKRNGRKKCIMINVKSAPEFFLMCRPNCERKRDNIQNTTIKAVKKKLRINEIKAAKENLVYNLETGTNNYIVNGLLVHNCDHNDFLDQRDSGWLMFCCERNQEVLDTVIQAYKVSEDVNVLLPSLINLDGFILSYTREPTKVPSHRKVDSFLPRFKPKVTLDPKRPMALGVGVMKEYSYFRSQSHLAQGNALEKVKEVQEAFGRRFGRRYLVVEPYMMDGAKAALVMMGANTTIARAAVKGLRKKGKRIGLVRLRLIRPFPERDLQRALEDVEAVGVVDQNLAPGRGGILYPEVKAALYDRKVPVSSFIISLGGKHISREEFERICLEVLESAKTRKGKVMWQGKFLQ